MNEENKLIEEPLDESMEDGWKEPPMPEKIPAEPKEEPQMSEVSTLVNIFFEPGRVFEDLRKKPRFILGGLLILIAISTFNIMLVEKVGFEKMVETQLESNAQVQQMSAKDKQELIATQSKPLFKYIGYAVAPIIWLLIFLLGALIYWLGTNAFGGSSSYLQSLSVWIYSSFPPTLLFIIANIILLLLKSVEDIDLVKAQRGGLLQANPSMFIDGKEMPVLAALLSSVDIFAIWGYVLAAIGLKVIGKISTGSAVAIVLILGLVGVTARVVMALLF